MTESIIARRDGKIGTVDGTSGNFSQIATSNLDFSDIALSNSGELFGITLDDLYKIDRNLGSASLVGNFGSGFSAGLNALEFANNILYAAGGSNLYTINSSTGAATLAANLGSDFNSSGDLVFDATNNLFLATSKGSTNDSLFSVSLTGQATKIGDIGFTKVFGLSFENGNLIGFTEDRKRITINSTTGTGTLDKNLTGVSSPIAGASSIPSATPTPTPPTPTPPTPTPPTPTPPTPTPPTPTPPTPTPPTVVTPTPTPPTVVTPTPTPPTVVTPTPTPPTVVTPTPTPPISIPPTPPPNPTLPPVPTVPPSQIPAPNASGEVDLDPLKLKVINGQFTFNDKTKRYEASGTIQIGRKDGIFPLINVQQGKVEYDDKTLSVDGTVFSNIGNVTAPLFQGKFAIERGKAGTKSLQKTERLSNELQLAGLDIDLKDLTLDRDQIRLGSELFLPQQLTGNSIKLSVTQPSGLFIGQNGIGLDIRKISLPTFKDFSLFGILPVKEFSKFSIEYIPPEDKFKIQGKLSVNPFFKSALNSKNAELVADLSGDNFIEIKDGKPDIKGSLAINNLKFTPIWGLDAQLDLDTVNKNVGGKAKVTYAFGGPLSQDTGFGLGLGFKLPIPPLQLNKVTGEIDFFNFPIFNTGAYLQEAGIEFNNIAQSDSKPFEVTVNGRITAGPEVTLPVLEETFSLIDANLSATVNAEQIKGTSKLKFLDEKLVKADQISTTLNWKNKFFNVNGEFSILNDLLKAQINLNASVPNFNIKAWGTVKGEVPKDLKEKFPFLPKASFSGNILLDFSNNKKNDDDYFAVWGNVEAEAGFGLFKAKINTGFKKYFDGRVEAIDVKNIPKLSSDTEARSGLSKTKIDDGLQGVTDNLIQSSSVKILPQNSSFTVGSGTKWLLLGANWKNEVTGNVPIEIQAPDGTIFKEADFAKTGRIAVVAQLTDSTGKVGIVFNPEPGVWNIVSAQ